jgi:hypothetical protein
MRIENHPNLLIKSELVRPLENSINMIRIAEQQLSSKIHDVLVKGAFVMVVAYLECALKDVLLYYLKHFPQKIEKGQFSFCKDEYFDNYFQLMKITIGKYIHEQFYKNFQDSFRCLLEILSIGLKSDDDIELLEHIQEYQATRNLLLHNNLRVNEKYISSAGPKKRAQESQGHITVKFDYVKESCQNIVRLELLLQKKILKKYDKYTRIAAHKRLWGFMFGSPLMKFDDYWKYDEDEDEIRAMLHPGCESVNSSSEDMKLGLWRAQWNDNADNLKRLNMRGFDANNIDKVLFFLSIAGEFPFQ